MTKFLSDKLIKTFGLIAFAGLTTVADAQTHVWAPAGPIYNAGRARNIVVDKSDASGNILYVGSTSSGVFKSTDAGVNWLPLNDQGTVRNISYMAQSANGTIYAGTGEGFLRISQKAKALPGTGLYKLVGNNLTQVANSTITGVVINKVACHPTQEWIALATDLGILISKDGGVNFTNANTLTPGIPVGAGTGLDIKFDLNGILWASIGSEVGTGTLGAISSTLWKSNADLTGFSDKTPSSAAVNGTNYGRIELAISPSNPGVVYASCAAKYISPASATLQGLFVTYDGGLNWGTVLVGSSQLDPLNNHTNLAALPVTRASGDYAHTLLVDPSNPDKIYFGGYSLYTFVRTGGSNSNPIGSWNPIGEWLFSNFQAYVHENIHDIKLIGSGNSTKYYITTDAGIFRSVDGLNSFQPFYKGLVTGQFNSVSIERYPLGLNTGSNAVFGNSVTPYAGFLGGTGGNGATYFRGNYPNVNQEVNSIGGDIFNCEFSKILPSAAIISAGKGTLYRNSDVKTADPAEVQLVVNTKSQTIITFDNGTYSVSGTPFKLWEYYGQLYKGQPLRSPDSLVFYNDTAVALSAIGSLSATTNFTFTIGRPQSRALIDYISIKMTTVSIVASAPTPSAITIPSYSVVNSESLGITMANTYTVPLTGTVSAPIASVNGYTNATPLISNSVIMNSSTNLDEVRVTLAAPLYTAEPSTAQGVANPELYVRMKATVYYKYPVGTAIALVDDNISTFATTYSVTTNNALQWTLPPTSTLNLTSNPIQKYAPLRSARLAFPYLSQGVFISKSPLDLNSPISMVKVSGNKALTTNSLGVATSNTTSVVGLPTILEWSKSGTELYYATDSNCVYRVSQLYTILDSTSKSYSGKLHTGIFTYSNTPAPPTYTATAFNTPNPRSPYRTTCLGKFSKRITSMSMAVNDSILTLTFDDPSGILVRTNTVDIRKCDSTNVGFINKTGTGLSNVVTYCSLMEKSDYKKVFVGTDNGIFYTSDITAGNPVWANVNADNATVSSQLPNVQVFDIKQQTLYPWECYNSGQIYVATNGRGVWTNNKYFVANVVSVKEIVKSATANNLSLYPNPANGEVYVSFNGYQGESATINVMDINGRIVKSDNLGKLNSGELNYSFDTNTLTSGVYIVNVTSDSGIRRVSKLIVTK